MVAIQGQSSGKWVSSSKPRPEASNDRYEHQRRGDDEEDLFGFDRRAKGLDIGESTDTERKRYDQEQHDPRNSFASLNPEFRPSRGAVNPL